MSTPCFSLKISISCVADVNKCEATKNCHYGLFTCWAKNKRVMGFFRLKTFHLMWWYINIYIYILTMMCYYYFSYFTLLLYIGRHHLNNVCYYIYFLQAPTINHSTFSRSFKEWKFCQFEVDHLQGHNWMKCPTCSIFQHSCHVDGNMKLYRYCSSGGYALFH